MIIELTNTNSSEIADAAMNAHAAPDWRPAW